ncbi:MAG: tripartite tricarboxylate transporter substrate-binding protein, partial [Betaproteobacteria bacterium]
APAKTPKDIVTRLSTALQSVLKNPEVIGKLRGVGVTPGTGDAQELVKYGPSEIEKYSKLIKAANIKAD